MKLKILIYNVLIFFEDNKNKALAIGVLVVLLGGICICVYKYPQASDTDGEKIMVNGDYHVTVKRRGLVEREYEATGDEILKAEKSYLRLAAISCFIVGFGILIGVFIYKRWM